jgi:LacI family transcriptional regulator
VAAETRARVEEIIARRDYARRPAKRRQKAGLIDLVFPGLGSEWALEIIEGVERVAQDAGYGTVVSSLSMDGSRIRPWLANLAELMAVYQLDAKQIQRIKSLGIPVVLIDPVGQPGPDLMTVGAANWDGGHSATEHLLQLGHRRIGMIGGREDLQCSSAREDGFGAAPGGHYGGPRTDGPGRFLDRSRRGRNPEAAGAGRPADGDLHRQ